MSCANHAEVQEALRTCARCGASFCADCVVVLQGDDVCAGCKEERLLDLLSGVPHGLPLASWRRRVGALIIDRGILWIVFFSALFGIEKPFVSWIAYGLYVIYEAIMLHVRGQTLGKIIMRIRVVRVDGAPLHAKQSWGRALLRGIFGSALQIVDDAPALFTKEKTCLHDMLARTRVVEI